MKSARGDKPKRHTATHANADQRIARDRVTSPLNQSGPDGHYIAQRALPYWYGSSKGAALTIIQTARKPCSCGNPLYAMLKLYITVVSDRHNQQF